MKCDSCGYISFDYHTHCPNAKCGKNLDGTRKRLGLTLFQPEQDFDELFTGGSGQYRPSQQQAAKPAEADLNIDAVGDEFEFTLDD